MKYQLQQFELLDFYSNESVLSCDVSRRGVVVSGVSCMNEVNAHRVRLVPGWMTIFGRVYHLGM